MYLVLPRTPDNLALSSKAIRIDSLIYYRLRNPFLHIETTKNQYDEIVPINLSPDMKEKLLEEITKLNVFALRVNLVMSHKPSKILPYHKIFKYEYILMLQSGLVDKIEILRRLYKCYIFLKF